MMLESILFHKKKKIDYKVKFSVNVIVTQFTPPIAILGVYTKVYKDQGLSNQVPTNHIYKREN